MTAMTAATIDQLSNGRMMLGIGSSGPQVAEGWHGQRFAQQLQRTREYVAVIRMALARERVEFKGETLELPLPDGPGKALKLTISPVQERIPIYLAAIGPRARPWPARSPTAGSQPCSRPSTSQSSGPCFKKAQIARANHWTTSTSPPASASVSPTTSRRDATRCAPSLRSMSAAFRARASRSSYNQLVRRYGYEDEAQKIQDLYLEGKRDEAMAAIPDKLIDTVLHSAAPRTSSRSAWPSARCGGRHTRRDSHGVHGRRAPRAAPDARRTRSLRFSPVADAKVTPRRLLLGAFGDPGHAFPMIALGEGAGCPRPRGDPADLQPLAGGRRRRRA